MNRLSVSYPTIPTIPKLNRGNRGEQESPSDSMASQAAKIILFSATSVGLGWIVTRFFGNQKESSKTLENSVVLPTNTSFSNLDITPLDYPAASIATPSSDGASSCTKTLATGGLMSLVSRNPVPLAVSSLGCLATADAWRLGPFKGNGPNPVAELRDQAEKHWNPCLRETDENKHPLPLSTDQIEQLIMLYISTMHPVEASVIIPLHTILLQKKSSFGGFLAGGFKNLATVIHKDIVDQDKREIIAGIRSSEDFLKRYSTGPAVERGNILFNEAKNINVLLKRMEGFSYPDNLLFSEAYLSAATLAMVFQQERMMVHGNVEIASTIDVASKIVKNLDTLMNAWERKVDEMEFPCRMKGKDKIIIAPNRKDTLRKMYKKEAKSPILILKNAIKEYIEDLGKSLPGTEL